MTKQAINTRTQEEYDALMSWRKQTGQPYLGNGIWQTYQEDTCIDFDNGNWAAFSGIEWYKSNGYTIIPYTEFAKTIEPDYKALYLEGRELLEGSLSILKQTEAHRKATGLTLGNIFLESQIEQSEAFLTKHNDLT